MTVNCSELDNDISNKGKRHKEKKQRGIKLVRNSFMHPNTYVENVINNKVLIILELKSAGGAGGAGGRNKANTAITVNASMHAESIRVSLFDIRISKIFNKSLSRPA